MFCESSEAAAKYYGNIMLHISEFCGNEFSGIVEWEERRHRNTLTLTREEIFSLFFNLDLSSSSSFCLKLKERTFWPSSFYLISLSHMEFHPLQEQRIFR